jgi:hypothetical protein
VHMEWNMGHSTGEEIRMVSPGEAQKWTDA